MAYVELIKLFLIKYGFVVLDFSLIAIDYTGFTHKQTHIDGDWSLFKSKIIELKIQFLIEEKKVKLHLNLVESYNFLLFALMQNMHIFISFFFGIFSSERKFSFFFFLLN